MKFTLTPLLKSLSLLSLAVFTAPAVAAIDPTQPYLGNWALTIPGGGAGWLGIVKTNGYYDASILWGGGSVVPVASVFFDNNNLGVMRLNEVKRKDASGKVVRTHQFPELILAQVAGDELMLRILRPKTDGSGMDTQNFTGKRIPPLPPAPDLSKVKFGPAVRLFNGEDLTGWVVMGNNPSGWRSEKGVLSNHAPQEPGKHKSYANLRTEQEFEDFNLQLETRVPKNGNSGIYLRGIYEIQVADSFGKPLDSHNMGGVYSRVTPLVNAEKPAGEWQTYDITLVDRHVTVILNGKKIHDNAPLLGCTGGAMWSDESKPGPIYLQGDHTSVEYRNIVLKPVLK